MLLDDYRLGLTFMAAAPRGQQALDYEAEESAILRAVGDHAIDLWVEESGDPQALSDRLAALGALPALHVSCHGDNAWRPAGDPHAVPRPVLWLEDAEGNAQPTDAEALIKVLRVAPPRLVFLSACLSAAAAGTQTPLPRGIGDKRAKGAPDPTIAPMVHSLATALVEGGVPAVLGWDGSMADGAATAFAQALYGGLAKRLDLATAVAEARRGLLNAPLELAGASGQDLLRGLTLFQVPVPLPVTEVMAQTLGGAVPRLGDLGLLDEFEDLIDPRVTARAVNALVVARLAPLSAAEQLSLAKHSLPYLFKAWGGIAGDDRRPPAADQEITRLGLLAEDGAVVAACAAAAVAALEGSPVAVVAALGQRAIELLDRQGREVPWRLLSRTAGLTATAGEGAVADTLLERRIKVLEARQAAGEMVDPLNAGFLVYEQAQRLMTRGELEAYRKLGRAQEAVEVDGLIRQIEAQRGPKGDQDD